MVSKWRILGVVLGLTIASAPGCEHVDPCAGKFMGARLLGDLVDISFTTRSLRLLNGGEDPKLKRFLEWQLLRAAAEARRHVEEGAKLDRSSALRNLATEVEDANAYITEHDLENMPPVPADKDVAKPLENLRVVKEWISKQP